MDGADWHNLVERNGNSETHRGSDSNLRYAAGIDHGPPPPGAGWPTATTESISPSRRAHWPYHVPYVSEDVKTPWRAWNWESIRWLRSVFIGATTLDHLREPPETPPSPTRASSGGRKQRGASEHALGSDRDGPRRWRRVARGCTRHPTA
jgi:hypothetical protein